MSKTIIERMCSIAEKMRPEDENSGLPIANMKKASTDIKALAKTLELTDVLVVILTAIVQKTARYSVSGNELADELGLGYLKFLTYNKETVELKVVADQVKYFDSLPLHWTQKKVEETPKYTVYSYHLIPSFDFRQEILGRGGAVEVLMPDWFRQEVKEEIAKMVKNYD